MKKDDKNTLYILGGLVVTGIVGFAWWYFEKKKKEKEKEKATNKREPERGVDIVKEPEINTPKTDLPDLKIRDLDLPKVRRPEFLDEIGGKPIIRGSLNAPKSQITL